MTCIVAVIVGDEVVMGAESSGADLQEREMYTIDMPKVFRAGPWIVGYSGSYRLGQILKFSMTWPEPPEKLDYEFMATEMVRALHDCLSKQFDSKQPDGAANRHWQILIGYRGKVFGISYKYDVISSSDSHAAIGGGRKVALGALQALAGHPDLSPRERVERALEVACKYVPGLRGPFVIESLVPEAESALAAL